MCTTKAMKEVRAKKIGNIYAWNSFIEDQFIIFVLHDRFACSTEEFIYHERLEPETTPQNYGQQRI